MMQASCSLAGRSAWDVRIRACWKHDHRPLPGPFRIELGCMKGPWVPFHVFHLLKELTIRSLGASSRIGSMKDRPWGSRGRVPWHSVLSEVRPRTTVAMELRHESVFEPSDGGDRSRTFRGLRGGDPPRPHVQAFEWTVFFAPPISDPLVVKFEPGEVKRGHTLGISQGHRS